MSDNLVIRLGWFPLIRWGGLAAFFASIAVYSAFSPTEVGEEPDTGLAWVIAAVAILCALVALRCLWLKFRGQPEAVLSPEGVRARACDSVLIPWDLVTSVTVDSKTATVSTDVTPTTVAMEEATRHAVYQIMLDKKVLEIGVKHCETLFNIGFKLVPANLTASSAQIHDAFTRFLPADRCRGFARTSDPTTASDFARRGMVMVAAAIVEAKDEAATEEMSSGT